jgi:hypothetical protein
MTQSTVLVALVRTLASGHTPGTVQAARRATGGAGPYPVRHALDSTGAPLLLTAVGDPVDRALTAPDGYDVATVLAIATPDGGQLCISGWSKRLPDAMLRDAVLEFAEHNPVNDLLDVGRGHTLHRLEVAEIRLEHADGHWIDIDPDDYAAG